jgi:hypothetical protein
MQLTVKLVEGEPRIHDLMLAERLEFSNPVAIRQFIKRNEADLLRYSSLSHCVINSGSQGGRPATEYWLSEGQALFICTKSGTPKAADITEEVIKTFIAWRHGGLVPASSQVTLTAIGELFDERLTPVVRDIANVQMEVSRLDDKMTLIYRRVDDIVPRRDFTVEAKRQFRCIVVQKYNNECPCCRQAKLENDDGEFDHYLGRELSGPEHGWLTCKNCNQRMASDALFKASRRSAFDVFQELRRQMFGNGSAPKPRKGSPTSSSSDQGSLF